MNKRNKSLGSFIAKKKFHLHSLFHYERTFTENKREIFVDVKISYRFLHRHRAREYYDDSRHFHRDDEVEISSTLMLMNEEI